VEGALPYLFVPVLFLISTSEFRLYEHKSPYLFVVMARVLNQVSLWPKGRFKSRSISYLAREVKLQTLISQSSIVSLEAGS